jgi:hypothetical protein
MLIHLPRLADPHLDLPVAQFTMHAATDRVRAHRLTDSPEAADVILFTQCHMLTQDWRLKRLRQHPLQRSYPETVMVYNESDRPWCALPGVYVNMPKPHFVAEHQRAWGYFVPPSAPSDLPRDLLFSFVASDTTPSRRPLFTLSHPDAIVEEVHGFRFWDQSSERFDERRSRHRSVLARSRFVLCPRGNGTSSVRLYETLAAGAVPVIMANDWTPPSGPSWERFSIRWPEGRVQGLTEMLEAWDVRWPQMSREARRAYDEFFSPEVYFHHVAERCADLVPDPTFPAPGVIDRHYAMLAAGQARARMKHVLFRMRKAMRHPLS